MNLRNYRIGAACAVRAELAERRRLLETLKRQVAQFLSPEACADIFYRLDRTSTEVLRDCVRENSVARAKREAEDRA